MKIRKVVSGTEIEASRPEIPADVASLYTWARLEGARYRDFSAARRESRAHSRQRAAQLRYQKESIARDAAERSALQSENDAKLAEARARFHEAMAIRALGEGRSTDRATEELAWQAAEAEAKHLALQAAGAKREADRRAQAQALAKQAEYREGREAAEAHASALRQAERYGVGRSAAPSPRGTLEQGPRSTTAQDLVAGAGFGLSLQPVMQPQRFPSRRSQGIALSGAGGDSSRTGDLDVTLDTRDAAEGQGSGDLLVGGSRYAGRSGAQPSVDIDPGTNPRESSAAQEASAPERGIGTGAEEVMPAWLREHVAPAPSNHDPKPQRAAHLTGRSGATPTLRASVRRPAVLADAAGRVYPETDAVQDGPDGQSVTRAHP